MVQQASRGSATNGEFNGASANARGVDMLGANAGQFAQHVFNSSPDCIKLIGLDGTLLFMNHNGQCAMEIDDFDLISGAQWTDLWPEDTQDRITSSVRTAKDGKSDRFEVYCPTAKGSPRWWDVSVAPVIGGTGRPEHIVSISRDITDRVEREKQVIDHEQQLQELALSQAKTLEEKEELLREKILLMQEVDHRVKNSLSMITSLLQLQGRVLESGEAQDALQRAANRVQTIASVHERLYREGAKGELDLAEYLQALCNDLRGTIGSANINLITDVAEAGRGVGKEAVTLGLIVTELLTNAARHAPEGDEECTVLVRCAPALGGRRSLVIEDDGCGLPADFDPLRSRGLGMRVVLANVKRINAELRTEASTSGGARFVVDF